MVDESSIYLKVASSCECAYTSNSPKNSPPTPVNVWKVEDNVHFSGSLDLSSFGHVEKAAINMSASSTVLLSTGCKSGQSKFSEESCTV